MWVEWKEGWRKRRRIREIERGRKQKMTQEIGRYRGNTVDGTTEDGGLLQLLVERRISILPETEIALTPLLTASSFFSWLDTLQKQENNDQTWKFCTNEYSCHGNLIKQTYPARLWASSTYLLMTFKVKSHISNISLPLVRSLCGISALLQWYIINLNLQG